MSASLGALLFAARASAYVTYSINCTAPPDNVNFVSGAPIRGTMSILWTSVSVLILCVWNVLHVSVPSHHEEKKKGRWGEFQGHLKEAWNKTKWMLIVVFMPEYLFAKAVCENCASYHSVKHFGRMTEDLDNKTESESSNPNLPWTATHAYFANMRGFVLRFKVQTVPTDLKPTTGSSEGRAVTHLSDRDDIPYKEQKVADAIKKEERQWREYCEANFNVSSAVMTAAKSTTGMGMPLLSSVLPGQAMTVERSLQPNAASDESAVQVLITTKSIDSSDKSTKPVVDDATVSTEPTKSLLISKDDADDNNVTIEDPPVPAHYPTWEGTWALSSIQFQHAYERGLITKPTHSPLADIKDRSKGDGLSKGITVLQILWLVTQIIARAAQQLAITLLEVTVLAFATTAIATYFVIWHKPQSVKEPIFVDADRPLTRRDVIELAARAPKSSLFVQEFWLCGVSVRAMADNIFPFSPGIPLPLPQWALRMLAGREIREKKVEERKENKNTRDISNNNSNDNNDNNNNNKKDSNEGKATSTTAATAAQTMKTTTETMKATTATTTKAKQQQQQPLQMPPLYISPLLVGLGVGGSIFGAVHCTAWNFQFPTPVEGLLWKIACLTLMLFPLLSAFVYWLRQHIAESWSSTDLDWTNRLMGGVSVLLVLVYVLARLFVIVETLRDLAYPAPSTFEEINWAAFIPHLG